jgi:hypothetical protein
MSLRETEPEQFVWACDTCDHVIEAQGEFGECWWVLKRRGWAAFKEGGEWFHACRECRRPSKARVAEIMNRIPLRRELAVLPPTILGRVAVPAEGIELTQERIKQWKIERLRDERMLFTGKVRRMIASSSIERTVDLTSLGPVGRSATVSRSFHFAPIFWLIP